MNYLAHAHYSSDGLHLLGNLLADFYTQAEKKQVSSQIQSGIMTHKNIDHFTDHHPEIAKAKQLFAPLVGRYSGAFVDVVLDYFLATDPRYSKDFWLKFSQKVYDLLAENKIHWPQKFHAIFPNMKENNWLYHYGFDWAIEFSFNNLFAKAKYLDKNPEVFECFMQHKQQLEQHYVLFSKDLETQDFLYFI